MAQSPKAPYKLSAVSEYDPDSPILYELLKSSWKNDYDGEPCALIRVKFVNMPKKEINNLTFNFNIQGIKEEARVDSLSSPRKELWLYVAAAKNAIMEATDHRGTKTNRQTGITFRSKHVYDVTLTCEKRQTINIITKPIGAVIKLDGEHVSTGRFNDVVYGVHSIDICYDGQLMKTAQIEVSDINNSFEFDLRQKKKFKIKSEPSKAVISINGKDIGFSPLEVELPFDNYQIGARLSQVETDSKTITVNEFTEDILLEPIKRKSFEVSAVYQSEVVGADLYVDGEIYKDKKGNPVSGQYRYTFNEPIGRNIKLRMSFDGATAERKIKVKQDMDPNQQIEIKPRNSITWWWEKEYNRKGSGFVMGYAMKQMNTQGNEVKHIYNGVWGNNKQSEWIKGIQVGFIFRPGFSWGLGIHTGIFYEYYLSTCDNLTLDEYHEHSVYIPVHAYYRFTFARNFALYIHGGVGADYCIDSRFSDSDDSYEDESGLLGSDGYPKKLNYSIEGGVGLRVGPFLFSGLYSKGLADHKISTYPSPTYKTTRDKVSVSLGILF